MDRVFRDPWNRNAAWRQGWITPPLDITENADEIVVRVELPGAKPEDIQIDVTGDVLTLRGEKSSQKDESGRDFCYCETEYGSFSRTVQLPGSVDPDKVDASYKDGVLTVTMLKRADAKPKRINVRGSETGEPLSGATRPGSERPERIATARM